MGDMPNVPDTPFPAEGDNFTVVDSEEVVQALNDHNLAQLRELADLRENSAARDRKWKREHSRLQTEFAILDRRYEELVRENGRFGDALRKIVSKTKFITWGLARSVCRIAHYKPTKEALSHVHK